ncbi:uncharacterized protein LOC126894448 isoform X2 [Daktulosphaira vitifoliae]|uniref:uncharacterized protein LOC126894448 isoform X2 n=1 Tax=Daktulosphaira vitifoliae TaxID=58002 RepID=UPI0021AA7DEC|nr:uncharacterized protein LOC126894448 isoform X2 [Daktulosphaira vitifoliae]
MAIILNIQVYLYIFIVFLHTEGITTKKDITGKINYFLHGRGWENITDVEYILYWGNKYKFEEVIIPVTPHNCNSCIRHATIFLGCSYANDLTKLFIALNKFEDNCYTILHSKKHLDSAYNCTVKLLENLFEVGSLATLMKGALCAIEWHHTLPWNKHKNTRFILSSVIENFQSDAIFHKLIHLNKSTISINLVLLHIRRLLRMRKGEILVDMVLCKTKPLDMDPMWNFLDKDLAILKSQEKYEEFFIMLSYKLSNLVQTIFQKKYVELGFIFDSAKNQTYITAPLIDQGDDTKNLLNNLTQQTNQIDKPEEAQDSTQNLLMNFREQMNETDVPEETQGK